MKINPCNNPFLFKDQELPAEYAGLPRLLLDWAGDPQLCRGGGGELRIRHLSCLRPLHLSLFRPDPLRPPRLTKMFCPGNYWQLAHISFNLMSVLQSPLTI